MEAKKTFQEKMKARMESLDSRIDVLKAKAHKAQADTKLSILNRVEGLDSERAEVNRRLEEMKEAGQEAWQDLKEGVESSVTELQKAVDQAVDQFA